MKKFSDELRKAREKKKLLQKDVANMFNWSAMYYMRYEKGDIIPSERNYKKFACFIRCSVKDVKKMIDNEYKEYFKK